MHELNTALASWHAKIREQTFNNSKLGGGH